MCTVRLTHIDLNLDELCYYPFITRVDRCDENCNIVESPFYVCPLNVRREPGSI